MIEFSDLEELLNEDQGTTTFIDRARAEDELIVPIEETGDHQPPAEDMIAPELLFPDADEGRTKGSDT